MVLLLVSIPLMVVGVAFAVLPLVIQIVREQRRHEATVAGTATAASTGSVRGDRFPVAA